MLQFFKFVDFFPHLLFILLSGDLKMWLLFMLLEFTELLIDG